MPKIYIGPGRTPGVTPPPPLTDLPGPGTGVGSAPILPAPVTTGSTRTVVFVPDIAGCAGIYGIEQGVGGRLVGESVVSDGGRLLVYLHCHGPISSVAGPYFNDVLYAGQSPIVTHYLGTGTQTNNALILAYLGVTRAYPWLAYTVVYWPANQPIPDPRSARFNIHGMLARNPNVDVTNINDPLLGVRSFTESPTLHIADFMNSPWRVSEDGRPYTYGAGFRGASYGTADVDEFDWTGSILASQLIDEHVLSNGSPRFPLGITPTGATPMAPPM